MIMSSCKRICITDRTLCADPLPEHLERLALRKLIDGVIVREKDLSENEYEMLLRQILAVCSKARIECVAHSFVEVAQRLDVTTIHLPLPVLRAQGKPFGFKRVGTGVHSLEEVYEAQCLGADYLIASHIFSTDCKPGIAPRGPSFLRSVLAVATVPVYALGGISDNNEREVIATGVRGVCRMSDYMKRA